MATTKFGVQLKNASLLPQIRETVILYPAMLPNYFSSRLYHLYIDDIDRIAKIYKHDPFTLRRIGKLIQEANSLVVTTTTELTSLFI
jgi:hypothetical protein